MNKNNKIILNEQKSNVIIISRRKRKENEKISVNMNKKPLEKFHKIKCLGIINDSKLNFKEHIIYISGKFTKLIHTLSKSAKHCWGLSLEAVCTIYTGAILPLVFTAH